MYVFDEYEKRTSHPETTLDFRLVIWIIDAQYNIFYSLYTAVSFH